MGDREDYLNTPWHQTEHSDHDKVVPPWLQREAQADDPDWEKTLEVESFARQFRNQFLEAEAIVADPKKGKTRVKSWEPDKAAEWLSKKAVTGEKFDVEKARLILDYAGCIDEKRTAVIEALRALLGEEPPAKADGSPTKDFAEVSTPPAASEVDLEKAENRPKPKSVPEKKSAEFRHKQSVGSYGVILTDDTCQVYREGECLLKAAMADYGGFDVIASEISAMTQESELELLFGLNCEAEVKNVGWLKPKTATPSQVFDNPAYQRDDQQRADSGGFDEAHVGPHDGKDPDLDPTSTVPGSPTRMSPRLPSNPDAGI